MFFASLSWCFHCSGCGTFSSEYYMIIITSDMIIFCGLQFMVRFFKNNNYIYTFAITTFVWCTWLKQRQDNIFDCIRKIRRCFSNKAASAQQRDEQRHRSYTRLLFIVLFGKKLLVCFIYFPALVLFNAIKFEDKY